MWEGGSGLDYVASVSGHVCSGVLVHTCESHMAVMFMIVIAFHVWNIMLVA